MPVEYTSRLFGSLPARLFMNTPVSLMGAPLKSAQKYKLYDPIPNDGRKFPLPTIRPVLGSTEMLAFERESDKSVRSASINGLYGSSGMGGAVELDCVEFDLGGNVKRYRAEWFETVISA